MENSKRQLNTLREDIIDMMVSASQIKRIASKIGLNASYVPCVGSIEILQDDIPIGISFDGYSLFLNKEKRKVNLFMWLKAWSKTAWIEKI